MAEGKQETGGSTRLEVTNPVVSSEVGSKVGHWLDYIRRDAAERHTVVEIAVEL